MAEMQSSAVAEPQTAEETKQSTRQQKKPRRQPPYAVILHNDDLNTFDHVISVLGKVFHYPVEKCLQLAMEAHKTGRSVVWTGTLEHAELKADQMRACGADPVMKAHGALALRVTIEPLPQ